VAILVKIWRATKAYRNPSLTALDSKQSASSSAESEKESSESPEPLNSGSKQNNESSTQENTSQEVPPPDLRGPEFKNATTAFLKIVPKELRQRVQIGVHEYKENKVWVHLKLDGARVELTEGALERKDKGKEYSLVSNSTVPLPKIVPVYQALSESDLKLLAGTTLNLPLDKIEFTSKALPLWQYKPGLTPIAVLEIKVKTENSTHSGEILRFSTPQGKLLKRYQSVRH
jgi:hypothetical protein